MIKATFWQAQLHDSTKMRGGQRNLFADDLMVSAVPIDQMKLFTLAHNAYCYTYFVPTKTWYKDGKPATLTYPAHFVLADGSSITVDKDEKTDALLVTQNY
ncbi:hypothetical protein M4D58_03140 [Brevibacillus borstelensis]|uniref:hypothetical protein n=1 Tax=Brevibacillus borstelensis TaxID=45462 RepID=UPI00203CC761|nr:hypothetical protein [Brevibacillus borstelensis]MCM3589624.1 hypothetical protein [Brevibacillus borstelensis]